MHALLARHCHRLPSRRHLATVAVGVSGGVDSSVAALLLRDQGHDVIGVHMSNWDSAEEGSGHCSEEDARDARRVCDHLGIGFHEASFVREYWTDVFEPFLRGYQQGGTPNPDIGCNRHIKFDCFRRHARALGADYIATGHYARLAHDTGTAGASQLLTAIDRDKDQTYFLSAVPGEALRESLFPIGHLWKSEVRALASEAQLHTSDKRDSRGICFVGPRNFNEFLTQYIPQQPGTFRCIESGRTMGTHQGYALYTPGQRARLSGHKTRWYIVEKCVATNTVFICEGPDHPALYSRSFVTEPASWVSSALPDGLAHGGPWRCGIRTRHPGVIVPCTVSLELHDPRCSDTAVPPLLRVHLDEPMANVAELQQVAFYDDAERPTICFGGAVVRQRGQSIWEERRALKHIGWSGDAEAHVSG